MGSLESAIVDLRWSSAEFKIVTGADCLGLATSFYLGLASMLSIDKLLAG